MFTKLKFSPNIFLMQFIENDEELCPMIDIYFDNKNFLYKPQNPIQNINIQEYNYTIFQNEHIHNNQIKPFFLCQKDQTSSILYSTKIDSKPTNFENNKITCETQIAVEPKFDFSELDKLYEIENEKFSKNTKKDDESNIDNNNEKTYNDKLEQLILPDNILNSQFFQKLLGLSYEDFSRILKPTIASFPTDKQNTLIQNMYNRIHSI